MQENRKKAMVIEDDKLLADLYKDFIAREFGIDTVICRSGSEVKGYAKNNCLDDIVFFICDLNIPINSNEENESKVDTFQGFELIESLLPPCRVIIASGYISPEITVQARNLGVISILQKPLNLHMLAILLNFLLSC